jgi:hypothetical protein
LPVDLATVADADDHDDQLPVSDLVDHAVLADSDSPDSVGASACKELRGARSPGEMSNCDANALARRIR